MIFQPQNGGRLRATSLQRPKFSEGSEDPHPLAAVLAALLGWLSLYAYMLQVRLQVFNLLFLLLGSVHASGNPWWERRFVFDASISGFHRDPLFQSLRVSEGQSKPSIETDS